MRAGVGETRLRVRPDLTDQSEETFPAESVENDREEVDERECREHRSLPGGIFTVGLRGNNTDIKKALQGAGFGKSTS